MNRERFIRRAYLEPTLNDRALSVYPVRTAILGAVRECLPDFSGELLDVGCGIMPYRELIREANPAVTSYTGLDLAASEVHDTSIADLHWDGQRIPLPDDAVDTVIATEFLEHSFEPVAVLAEIGRVLRPGGLFFFTVPFVWPLHEVPNDFARYTPFGLERLLGDAGFDSPRIRSLGGWHAAMAQMRSNLGAARIDPKLARRLARAVIPRLLKADTADHDFGHHCMVSGLYGTARKVAP